MVAKNIKGKGFGGCIRYVMNATCERLETEGVFADSAQSMIRSFVMQQSQRREIKQPVGHIPIAFSPEDKAKMTGEFMLQLAKEYMQEMGICNTQYIIVRHHNTDHDHLHIIYNRIDNDLKLISANNDYKRNIAACKKLKDRHGLTYGAGKEQVNRAKLHGKDEAKYAIYDAMKVAQPKSHNLRELSDNLQRQGVTLYVKHRRGSEHIEGISLERNDYKFKGSEIDRKFSYAGLLKLFEALTYLEEQQRRRVAATPKLLGVKLTPTQWETLQGGGSVWLEDMRKQDGTALSGYVTYDHNSKMATISRQMPKSAATELVDSATGIASTLFGAIDTPNSDFNPDESEFERQERFKKKRKQKRKI